MYGSDVERLIRSIDRVYSDAQSATAAMAASALDRQTCTMVDSSPVTITPGSHGHPDGSHSHDVSKHQHHENSFPVTKPDIASRDIRTEFEKIRQIEGKLYTSRNSLNSGIGSPYSEIESLVQQLDHYIDMPSALVYLGQHVAVGLLAQMVASSAINAKFAVIQYHDGLQRGYDACLNGGKPSISWDDFNRGTTTGNVR